MRNTLKLAPTEDPIRLIEASAQRNIAVHELVETAIGSKNDKR